MGCSALCIPNGGGAVRVVCFSSNLLPLDYLCRYCHASAALFVGMSFVLFPLSPSRPFTYRKVLPWTLASLTMDSLRLTSCVVVVHVHILGSFLCVFPTFLSLWQSMSSAPNRRSRDLCLSRTASWNCLEKCKSFHPQISAHLL